MTDDAIAIFEAHRARLFGIGYRMLGSAADADDLLQEARVRWLAADRASVLDVRAFLVTIVSRLALDQLGSARARREVYVGPWLPEPIATAPDADPHDLSLAFLHLLERLSPAERAAFLLVEVFDYSHAEVASILGKSEAACRQLASRARAHVRAGRPAAPPSDQATHRQLLTAFMTACATGDLVGLERLLAADVVVLSDGGGHVDAARKPITGLARASRMLVKLTQKGMARLVPSFALVNGQLAVLASEPDGTVSTCIALALTPTGDRIAAVYLLRNPAKLASLVTPRALA